MWHLPVVNVLSRWGKLRISLFGQQIRPGHQSWNWWEGCQPLRLWKGNADGLCLQHCFHLSHTCQRKVTEPCMWRRKLTLNVRMLNVRDVVAVTAQVYLMLRFPTHPEGWTHSQHKGELSCLYSYNSLKWEGSLKLQVLWVALAKS